MKKWLMMILLALTPLCAAAEEALPAPVAALLEGAHPGYTVAEHDMWGGTAAAVMAMGEERILCVAEKKDDAWVLAVDNPHALRRGETPDLLMDTDISLFWSYQDGNGVKTEYFASRNAEGWGPVGCLVRESLDNGYTEEAAHTWTEDGALWRTSWLTDENDNIVRRSAMAPVPAAWLEKYIRLADYTDAVFPKPHMYYDGSWLAPDDMEKCAQQLRPGCLYLGGEADGDGLELFVRKQDGALVLLGCLLAEDGWQITESAALPENTGYGWENFSDCLVLDGRLLAAVRPRADGVWGIAYTWPVGDGEMVTMGDGWIAGEDGRMVYGSHPWSDMTAIDWTALPMNLAQAKAGLKTDGWAVVHNPDPADRLHLRQKADRGAKSLGKYYSGTPVKVLARKGDWTQVEIFGIEGWMMTRYLVFGQEMAGVTPAFPDMQVRDGADGQVYAQPGAGPWTARTGASGHAVILGLVGDAWFHVWFPQSEQSGYMPQEDFWAGNG